MRRLALPIAVVVLGSACSEEQAISESHTVTDSAGVAIVSNGTEGALGRLVAREVLRLGVLEGGGPEQFSQVYAVAMNDRGEVFVGNNSSGTVRAFSADGSFLAELGGRGQGPGEVTMVNDVFAIGDTVGIVDWQRGGKLVLFALDGTMLATWSTRQADGAVVQPLHPTPDGWLTQVNSLGAFPQLGPGESQTVSREIHLMDFATTEPGPKLYSVPIYTLYGTSGPGDFAQDWALFDPRTYSGFDRQGRLYMTNAQAYRIDVHDRGGLRRSIRRSYSPRHLDESDIGDLKGAALHVIDTMSRMPESSRAEQRAQLSERIDQQASIPLPDVMTPLGDLLVSSDGSFWVRVYDAATLIQREADQMFGMFDRMPSTNTSWDLFDADGRYLGAVTLPPRFRAEAVRGFEVVGVWADALDVEYVVKFEVAPTR